MFNDAARIAKGNAAEERRMVRLATLLAKGPVTLDRAWQVMAGNPRPMLAKLTAVEVSPGLYDLV